MTSQPHVAPHVALAGQRGMTRPGRHSKPDVTAMRAGGGQGDWTTAYARAVVAGEVDACRYVVGACERHLADLGRGDLVWDVARAGHVFRFFELLRHVKGKWAGQRFRLHPFQHFVLGSIFGWRRPDGARRYRQAYVEVPRKNGKSLLCSGVGLYGLVADGEGGPEIYSVATKTEQAKIVWQAAVHMVRGCSDLNALLKCRAHEVLNDHNNGIFRPLASDSKTLDGLNPHFAIVDELHAWRDDHLYHVIKDGMGARVQPLLMAITTAGMNAEGICFELREHGLRVVREGGGYDDTFFSFISTIDEGDRWDDPGSWAKANPLLGVALERKQFENEVEQAKKIGSRRLEFQNVRLNMWIAGSEAWLDVNRWRELRARPLPDLTGERCYVGVDLGGTRALTAVVYLFPDVGGKMYVLPKFFMPRETIERRSLESANYYRHWQDRGYLEEGGGAAIDQGIVIDEILRGKRDYRIVRVCLDPWQAASMEASLRDRGIDTVGVQQGYAHLGAACRELEDRVAEGTLVHDGNPAMSWCVSNVIVDKDPNGNLKPNKKRSRDCIDGVSALLTALAGHIKNPNVDVFDEHYLPPGHPDRQ